MPLHYKMVGLHLRPRFDNGKKIKLLDTAQNLKFTYPEETMPASLSISLILLLLIFGGGMA
jgi:hypothetical protein